MPAGTAGSASQRVAPYSQRILELERLDGGRERVRHRHVHAARPVRRRARPLAATDRLVVGEAVVAERHVVHRPLALRRNVDRFAEGAHDDVDDARGRLDVAGRDGGRRPCVDKTAFRRGDVHRRERTTGGGEIRIYQDSHDVEARRPRDGQRTVEIAVVLLRSSREVDPDGIARNRDRDLERELAVDSLENVARLEPPVGKGGDPAARPPTSAWCARVTEKPTSVGETSVISGRCVPPVYGSLIAHTSPGAGSCLITAATASGIAPRWTGMCSACAIILPRSSKSAVEQSRRSLMFAEKAERTRTAPISSAVARRSEPTIWSSIVTLS